MNPNPLSSENHLTVPVPTDLTPLAAVVAQVRSVPRAPYTSAGSLLCSGPDVPTLPRSGFAAQAELSRVGRVRREVPAGRGRRAPRAAPHALAGEAQLGGAAQQVRVEAEVDAAGRRALHEHPAHRPRQGPGAVAQHAAEIGRAHV